MAATLRDKLVAHEQAVLEAIAAVREKYQADIVPLERDLADVRKAKAALADPYRAPDLAPPIVTAVVHNAPLPSPYAKATMKELIVRALTEQFPHGATALELIEFFGSAWGRYDIMRTSLSPQLSRLGAEGVLKRVGLIWSLDQGRDL